LALGDDAETLPKFVCCDRRLEAAATAAGFAPVISF
jgi:hypothetical protein